MSLFFLRGVWFFTALAVRAMSFAHWSLAAAMFIGWLAVPGRVLVGELRARGALKSRVSVDNSPTAATVIVEQRAVGSSHSAPFILAKLVLSPPFIQVRAKFWAARSLQYASEAPRCFMTICVHSPAIISV